MQKSHITLSESDRIALQEQLRQNGHRSRVYKRITALLELDKGKTIEAVRDVVHLSYPPVAKLIAKYRESGLGCLEDKKQSGRPPLINGLQRAAITALACSDAPEGHARWTLRLLADKVVELGCCEDGISHVHVHRILKKTK